MKPYTILIVDDDADFAHLVKKDILALYPDIFDIDIMKDTDIKDCLDTVQYDAYLLDIEMPAISGFEVAQQLYNRNEDVLLMFLTTHEELSMIGYEYSAFRFMSKGNYQHTLKRVMDAVVEKLKKSYTYIQVKNEAFVSVDILVNDIMYAYAEKNYVVLDTEHGYYQIRTTLAEFAKTYANFPFACPAKGILGNIAHIKCIDYKKSLIYLKKGKGNIKISRRKKNEFYEQYTKGFS